MALMSLRRTWIEGCAAFRRVQVRPSPALAAFVALVGLLAPVAAGTAWAVELRDAELVASGSPVLQNGTGTVRLEDARLGRLGPPVFIPEPGVLWQLGSGIGLLALLAGRRRRRTASRTAGAPDRADPATPRWRMP
jgi:hypothetical protein